MRKNMVDVVVKMKFRIGRYYKVCNRIGPGYAGLMKFLNVISMVVSLKRDIILIWLMLSFI
jgi:hypothetical protein